MKAKWLAKSGYCTQVDKFVETGKEYTGADHVVKEQIQNGLAVEVKDKPKKVKKEK